jgi:hypothetical protein
MYVEKHGAVSVVDGTGQTSANNRGEAEQPQDLAQLLPGAYGLLEQWVACHVARRHQSCAKVQIKFSRLCAAIERETGHIRCSNCRRAMKVDCLVASTILSARFVSMFRTRQGCQCCVAAQDTRTRTRTCTRHMRRERGVCTYLEGLVVCLKGGELGKEDLQFAVGQEIPLLLVLGQRALQFLYACTKGTPPCTERASATSQFRCAHAILSWQKRRQGALCEVCVCVRVRGIWA